MLSSGAISLGHTNAAVVQSRVAPRTVAVKLLYLSSVTDALPGKLQKSSLWGDAGVMPRRRPPVKCVLEKREAGQPRQGFQRHGGQNGIFSIRSIPDQQCGAQVSLSVRLLPGMQSGAGGIGQR